MNTSEIIKPTNRVMMDGLIKSRSALTICQDCLRNAQPREKFSMLTLHFKKPL
jgi:hypothetical protein